MSDCFSNGMSPPWYGYCAVATVQLHMLTQLTQIRCFDRKDLILKAAVV